MNSIPDCSIGPDTTVDILETPAMKRSILRFLLRPIVRACLWVWAAQACIPGYPRGKFDGLSTLAFLSLAKGKNDQAKRHAHRLLEIAPGYECNWNYGNAIHKANLILGLVARREGDLSGAKQYLLKSADVRGSPQLDSFGPNMRLAKELLEAGEADAVLDYLDRCRSFWEMGIDRIEYWQAQIRKGEVPDFGANLVY